MIEKYFVTGAAGFIGSNLVDRLLAVGRLVTGWDNFSTGRRQFLTGALAHPNFRLIEGDNLDPSALARAMAGSTFVFHLAANADVQFGTKHPRKDFDQNTVATLNVLEAMRANGIARLAYSSTGSVYGDAQVIPTPEDAPFPVQTSLYGASKVAGEGLLTAFTAGYGFETTIFRIVSILGERYTHGHIYDFYRQLLEHPDWLRVLGDGRQRKSYLYVQDCLDAMLHVISRGEPKPLMPSTSIYNLGTPEYVDVNGSIGYISEALGLKPALRYTGGERGWIGDSPFLFLDTKRVQATGWKPKVTIKDAIVRTLRWIEANPWVYTGKG
jgi:UDP-glucose 4-epimerase